MKLGKKMKEHLSDKAVLVGAMLISTLIYFQFLARDWFYVVLFLLLFIQVVLRRRSFLFLSLLVFLVLILQTSVLNTLTVFRVQSLGIMEQPKKTLRVIFTPNAGEDVLPDEVQAMLYLVRLRDVPNYRLSPSLSQDPLMFQRAIEATWNAEYQDTSSYVFYTKDDFLDNSDCDYLEENEGVYLAYCD